MIYNNVSLKLEIFISQIFENKLNELRSFSGQNAEKARQAAAMENMIPSAVDEIIPAFLKNADITITISYRINSKVLLVGI